MQTRTASGLTTRLYSYLLAGAAVLTGLAMSPLAAQATPVVLRGQLSGHWIKIRSEPNVESTVVTQQPMGTVAERLDQLRQPNGRIWGNLRFVDGVQGWVPLDYWRPVDRIAYAPDDAALTETSETLLVPSVQDSMPQPARWTGRLIPAEIGAGIKMYEQPGISEQPRYRGALGERVQIFNSQIGPEGYLWYHVSLPSFLQGWVRADQVQQVRDVLR